MTLTVPGKYIRTEPPAQLTEPLTITLDGFALATFNAYRQARHAYFAAEPGSAGRTELLRRLDDERGTLSACVLAEVQKQLGEPNDFGPAES